MSRIRGLLEQTHKVSAATAGDISLLLTQDGLTKRDVKRVADRLERLRVLEDQLRALAGLTVAPERGRP